MPTHMPSHDEIDAMRLDILAANRADDRGRGRLRSLPTRVRNAATLGTLLLLNAVVALQSPRADLGAIPQIRLVVLIVLLLVFAALGSALFLRPLYRRPLRRTAFAVAVVALAILPMAFALLPAAHDEVAAHPESFVGVGHDFWPRVLGCLFFGTLVGLPVAAILLVMDRRSNAGAGRLLLAAGCGGAAGTLGLLLHCPLESVAHRLTGHGAVAVSIVLVLGLARIVIRRRRNSGKAP